MCVNIVVYSTVQCDVCQYSSIQYSTVQCDVC